MTVVNPKSISGITSITTASGSDNLLTIHTSDASNTERFRIDSTGTTKIVTGIVTTLTSSKISLPDSSVGSINVGLSSDLAIYHDGSNSFIKNSTGNLRIQDADGNIQIQAKAGEESIIAKTDGAVELYHNNSKKLETSSTGVTITGGGTFTGDVAVSGANITLQDSGSASDDRIALGTGGDLHIYFDGSNSYIKEPNSVAGQLIIDSWNGTDIRRGETGEHMIRAIGSGAVQLYHNGTEQCATSANGLAFPSGKGIDFSATANGGTGSVNELLDDYEEGTWTPTVTAGGSAFSTTNASYVKIGRMVFISFDLTNNSGGDIAAVFGLPFAVSAYAAFNIAWISNSQQGAQGASDTQGGLITTSTNNLGFRVAGGNNTQNVANGVRFIGSGAYETSS